MSRPFILALALTSALLAANPAKGQQLENHHPRRVRAYRVAEPPTLDGAVIESVWEPMEPANEFIQQNPNEGALATEQTEVRIGFDDNNLYFGIICFDSEPDKIVVTQNRRDGELEDTDSVQILLDTFNDNQNAVIFGTSPTGIEFDAQVSKAGQQRGGGGGPARAGGAGGAQRGGSAAFNLNWDAVWEVRSQITKRGWESEIVIPFRTLRYRPGHEQVWGFNISRNLRRRNEQSFWAPVSRAFEFTQIELAGDLYGLETRTQRNLKFLPYVLGESSQNYRLSEDQSEIEVEGGLDIKYSVTPGLTLDVTFNTDFAQVEVDDEQINLTRFDLFFPEKRPFFLENSGFFEFGSPQEVEIFFSRRIGLDENRNQVPIDAGVRLSGKMGPYQIGLLDMQTSSVDSFVPANNYAVARFSRELPNRSSIGVIGVNRESTSSGSVFEDSVSYNRTFGADANIGIGEFGNWFNYVAKTQSPHLEGSDHAYSSRFEYDDSKHQFNLGYLEVGHNFNPEVGFVRRVGFRKPTYFYRYTHYPQSGPIRSIEPHHFANHWFTVGTNERESGFEHYHVDSRWHNGGRLGIAWNRNFERIDEPFEIVPGTFVPVGRYSFSEVIANFGTDPSAKFFVNGNAATGSFYDGTIRSVSATGGYRRGKNLTWTGSWVRNFIDLSVGDFTTDLVGLRFNWSFTPKSFFQTFSQYNSTTNEIGHNLRLGLLSTSSTGLFVVFNTRTLTRDFLDPHEVERRTLSRALFIKFNYLLDY